MKCHQTAHICILNRSCGHSSHRLLTLQCLTSCLHTFCSPALKLCAWGEGPLRKPPDKKFVPIEEHCIYGFCYRPNGKTTQRTRRQVCNRLCSWGEGRGSFNRTAPMAVGLSADGASYTAAHWPLSHERLLRPATTKASAKSSIVVTRQENGHLITSYPLYCIRPHCTAQHVGKRSMNGGASDIEFRTPRRQRLKVVELEVHQRPVPSQRSQQEHGDLRGAPSYLDTSVEAVQHRKAESLGLGAKKAPRLTLPGLPTACLPTPALGEFSMGRPILEADCPKVQRRHMDGKANSNAKGGASSVQPSKNFLKQGSWT